MVVKLLLHNPWQLFLHVLLQKLNNRAHIKFLIHDCDAPLRLVAAHDQSGKQDFFELLIAEVWERKVAELLKDSVLTPMKNLLTLFVLQAIVADQHHRLMEQLSRVFILVIVLVSVNQQVMQQVEQLVLDAVVLQHL